MRKIDWNKFWRAGGETCGSPFVAAIVLGLTIGAIVFEVKQKLDQRKFRR